MIDRIKLSLTAAVGAMLIAAAPAPSGSPAAAARTVEDQTTAALLHHDSAAYAKLIAADWHGQDDSGKLLDRTGLLDHWFPNVRFTSMSVRLNQIRVVGGVAIVLGEDTEKSSYAGKNTSGRYTWIDVIANDGGAWRIIATQITKVS